MVERQYYWEGSDQIKLYGGEHKILCFGLKKSPCHCVESGIAGLPPVYKS